MSLPNRASYQKPTKSSSSSSSSSASSASGGGGGGGGGALGARWNGNYSAGVSPVRGLSPVRGTFHGVVGRQELDLARSHTNPLFNSRTSDIGRGGALHTTPTKACKECKENREKLQEPWKVSTVDCTSPFSGKTSSNPTTPTGKSMRNTATMRFTTPPKPVVKRKILAENREFAATTCPPTRMKEETKPKIVAAAASPPAPRVAVADPPILVAIPQFSNDESLSRGESEVLSMSSALSPEPTREDQDPSKPRSPLVSIEELQKRIQKFLQDEGATNSAAATTAAVGSVPMMMCSPRQSTESLRMSLSGTSSFTVAGCGEEMNISSCSLKGFVEDAPFQPVVAPYSPRPGPEFSRARKSLSMEGNVVSPHRGEADSLIQEKTTSTTPNSAYDPKNNFLSPRPQFLRYRPLRRLELLRKSVEGTLGDLDLESPATDADSSRIGSEKDVDEKEVDYCESQDVSQQEVESLKSASSSSSLESPPPRCRVSSHELFKSASVGKEGNGEIVQLSTRENPEQQQSSSISSMQPPPEAYSAFGSEAPFNDSKLNDSKLNGEEDEFLEEEDGDDVNDHTTWYYNACGIFTIFALVALLVIASGSPALLPKSLHQNHISHLWKTSKVTQPIRQFLQTTEGLWAENPHLVGDFSISTPDIVRVGWLHVYSSIQSHVDLVRVVENGKVVGSFCMEFCMECGAKFGRFMRISYTNLKASLETEMEFNSSRNGQEDVNEWGWVPDYEFVVPHDMFDPVEAYANIMARVESWGVKSLWSPLVKLYAKLSSSGQVVEEPLDSTLVGRNASLLCSLCPAGPVEDVAFLGRVFADIPIFKATHDIEPTKHIAEQSEDENALQELNVVQLVKNDHQEIAVTELSSTPNVFGTAAEIALSEAIVEEHFSSSIGMEGVLLSHHTSEEVQLVASVTEDQPQLIEPVDDDVIGPTSNAPKQIEENTPRELNAVQSVRNDQQEIPSGTPDIIVIAAERTSVAIVEVEPFSSPTGSQIPLSQDVGGVQLSHDAPEQVQLPASVAQQKEPFLGQEDHQAVPFQDSLKLEDSVVEEEAVPTPSTGTPEENDVGSAMPLATKPTTTPRSLFLDELMMQAPGFRTTAAIFASLLLAAGLALLVFHKMYTRSASNSRPAANLKASAAEATQTFSKASVEPTQFVDTSDFYPIQGSPGSEFLAEDLSMAVHLSFDQVRQFSTPYPVVSSGTPDQLLVTGMDKDSLKKPSKQVADVEDTLLQAPNAEMTENSSLGMFTTLVPVLHNEGTARERVQLTPVRRSSRIRTRMQNSPCHLMHTAHLCNC
ncbi:unnamed protein product [Calypogeia fissa]